jgi:alpha-N-acetylglucosaminidase
MATIHFKFKTQSLENGHVRFPVKGLEKRMDKASKQLAESRKIIPVESNGNALNISRWLFYKYLGNLNELPLVHRTMLPNE